MEPNEAILRDLIEWYKKVRDDQHEDGCPAGVNYLNGDSTKHPGSAWLDMAAIIKRAKAAVRRKA